MQRVKQIEYKQMGLEVCNFKILLQECNIDTSRMVQRMKDLPTNLQTQTQYGPKPLCFNGVPKSTQCHQRLQTWIYLHQVFPPPLHTLKNFNQHVSKVSKPTNF